MITTCEFSFGFWDVSARSDAALVAANKQVWSRAEDILKDDLEVMDIATLEPDFGWPLDGTKSLMPNNPTGYTWGWWSAELSGEDGLFSNPPQLTITFSDDTGAATPHSSVGITLDFAATLPETVNIKWYGEQDNLLSSKDFTPNSYRYFCENSISNYYKLVITIPSMQEPQRYLRVTGIIFGVIELIDNQRVTQATIVEETNPAALTLPINTLKLSFYTPDGRFELLNPQGAYSMIQFKQEIKAYKTIDNVKSYMGKYYLQEATGTVDAVTQLSCIDVIGLLDTLEYKGGLYTNTPVTDLLNDILAPDDIAYTLDSAFVPIKITGYLAISSKRVALQQIAIAIGAIIDPTHGETIKIYPAPALDSPDISITSNRKIIGHKITLEELVTQVDVTAHEYTPGEDSSLKEVAKASLGVGVHTITFSSPAEVSNVRGGSLKMSHPNYCIVEVSSPGEVIVKGYPYVDTTTIYTAKTETLPAGTKTGVKSITGATLIDPTKAQAAAIRVYNYYQLRYKDEGRLLPGNETIGNIVEISSMGGNNLTGYIQRITTDLSNGGLETITVKGG